MIGGGKLKELDDVLQHFGVKGMRWGVLRPRIATSVKTRKAHTKASLEKFHESNQNKKSYKKAYKKYSKRSKDHLTAVKKARKHVVQSRAKKINFALKTAAVLTPLAARQLTKPENIRRGKNLYEAFKGSPIRYVDGSKFTNVVDMI